MTEPMPQVIESGMGEVMEMYDDHVYLMYINGKLAAPTPVEKKNKNQLERVINQALPKSTVQEVL